MEAAKMGADWRVGLFFLTFFPADHPDERWRGKPQHQGRVLRQIGDAALEVQFYGWLMGEPIDREVKPLAYFERAAWYSTEEDWVAAGSKGIGQDSDEAIRIHRALKGISPDKAARSTKAPGATRRDGWGGREVAKRLRFKVFKRDYFMCTYCGKRPPEVELEIDHVIPISKGGLDEEANLVTSCNACNRGKRDTVLELVPDPPKDGG